MVDRDQHITEDELHAYIDGELPADRRDAVEGWLATHSDDAERVAAWRSQMEHIHARYGAVAAEPVPARLNLDRLARNGRRWIATAVAATAAAFLIGGVIGWMAHGVSAAAPPSNEALATEAMNAHRLYIAEVRHPIEVRAAEQHLVPWLSRRVGTTLRTPELASFDLKLLGGRLLPGPIGPAALFMYESPSGERFTIYCSRVKAPTTALRYNAANQIAAVHWVESDIGFVVSGPADKDRLTKIAQSAYEQMENRGAAPSRSTELQFMSHRGS
jgi:anti-sigma factor RsiW